MCNLIVELENHVHAATWLLRKKKFFFLLNVFKYLLDLKTSSKIKKCLFANGFFNLLKRVFESF